MQSFIHITLNIDLPQSKISNSSILRLRVISLILLFNGINSF